MFKKKPISIEDMTTAFEASKELTDNLKTDAFRIRYFLRPEIDDVKGVLYILVTAKNTTYPLLTLLDPSIANNNNNNMVNEWGSLDDQKRLKELIPNTFEYKGKSYPVKSLILSAKKYS